MKIKASTLKVPRREFLRSAGFAVAAFNIVPGAVLGLRGQTPASEKLNIAGIGVAGQGGSDLNQLTEHNILALCDVDWRHAAGTFKKFPKARQWKDCREMLDQQKDIDAVIVATPDHMHAFASILAMKHGKHVYCEKPLTHSVWEARQVAKFAREKKLATQMGNQGQASEGTRRLCETVWSGVLGPIREAHVWTDRPSNGLLNEYWPQGVGRPTDTPAVPDTLAWDLWLGPAPERPYHPAYAPFKWRGWWDFGTGALGDIGCHSFDPVFRALKLGHPISIEASSTRVNNETYPLASMVTYHFPARASEPQKNNAHLTTSEAQAAARVEMPPLKLVWYDGGLRPPRPVELEEEEQMGAMGTLLIGDKGKMLSNFGRGGSRLLPKELQGAVDSQQPIIPRSQGHYKEWAEACKGGKPAGSNFDWAGPLAEVVLLGNIALRPQLREQLVKHKLLWDAEKLQITNLPDANKFLRREYRKGWEIEI
jgi:predicted dehydrogenase